MRDYDKTYQILEIAYDKGKRKGYWEAAIGLQKVDHLSPSAYLLELKEENINGNISNAEIEQLLCKKYGNGGLNSDEAECDIVSNRMVELLEMNTFTFSPVTLKFIHGYLFKDIIPMAGEFRQYNITKEEEVLNGESVIYGDFRTIKMTLDYDFDLQKEFSVKESSEGIIIGRIAKFSSSIWQVHPFPEGNTRTTAVFMEQYLNHLGFPINNDMFKEYALYYRNAMVRSNYVDYGRGIDADFRYLNMFYGNLLFKKENLLSVAEQKLCFRTSSQNCNKP